MRGVFCGLTLVSSGCLRRHRVFDGFIRGVGSRRFFLRGLRRRSVGPAIGQGVLLIPRYRGTVRYDDVNFQYSSFSRLFRLDCSAVRGNGREKLLNRFVRRNSRIIDYRTAALHFRQTSGLFRADRIPYRAFLGARRGIEAVAVCSGTFHLYVPFLYGSLMVYVRLASCSIISGLRVRASLLTVRYK